VKKYLAVVLGIILILSFAVTVFAEDKSEITVGGKIVERGWFFENANYLKDGLGKDIVASQYLPIKSDSQALYTSNVYLTLDAKVSDNVRGFIELETAAGTSGNVNSGVYYWGTYDSKPNADMLIRQAWIQYTGSGLLGIPAGIKIGHFMVALGEKQFLDNTRFGNDGIMAWIEPSKDFNLTFATTKLNEGTTKFGDITHSDDVDGYFLIATYMPNKDNKMGLNLTWARSDAAPATAPLSADNLEFGNIGVHANGRVAGLSYAAEADSQLGYIKPHGADQKDFRGWAIYGKVGYTFDPVTVRVSAARGSGDGDKNDDSIKEFQAIVGPDTIGPIARFTHYTLIYERILRTAANQQIISPNVRTTSIANTTYANLGVDINPVKELNLSVDGFMLTATNTGEWGNGSNDLGWEIDGKMSYKIAKNLVYFVEAGLFKPGHGYDKMVDSITAANKIPDVSLKTSTMAVHGLSLTF
jgi:hypothetical protein